MADPSTLVDRVKVFTTSSGTGPFTLGAAAEAFRGVEALTGGLIYSYAAENGADFEVGQGQYVAETTQLIRTPFESSLGAGALVPFPANTPVAFTALASDLSGTGSATAAAASANAAAASAGVATAAAEAAGISADEAAASAVSADTSADAAADSATDADASAVAAAAAAASVGVPSYSNTQGFAGQGDRTATAVVSDLGTLAFNAGTTSADWNKLIDGTLAGKTPVMFIRAGAVAGKLIGMFPKPSQLPWFKIGGLRARQANTVDNGTWEPVIYRGVLFDSAGNAVSASEIIPVGPPVHWNVATLEFPSTNIPSVPGEGAGWRGVSGTAAGASYLTGLFQFEAKTLTTDGYGLTRLPRNAARGTVPMQGDAPNQFVPAEPIDFNAAAQTGSGLLAEYYFNEGAGETVYDRSGNGRNIVFDAAYRATFGGVFGTNYVWTPRGLLLRKAMVQTGSLPSSATVVAFYVPTREDGSTVQFNVSANTAINSNNVRMAAGGATQSTQTVHVGHGGEGVVPLYRDSNGNNGYALSRGGPLLVFTQSGSAITGNLGMGGQANVTADTVRSTSMTCIYFAVYSGSLTSDQRTAVRRALRRSMAVRGIRIDWRDCETVLEGAFNIGQSNVGNESISVVPVVGPPAQAGLSAANLTALSFTPHTYILSAGRRADAAPMARPGQYLVGFNSFPGFRSPGMGFEAGMALAHEKANPTARRDLSIVKIAPGSSNVSDATALSWNVTLSGPGTNLTGWALKCFRDNEQDWLNQGIGFRLRAVNTQNGEQEANNTGVGLGWPAAYQANMQDIWNKLKEQLLFDGIKMQVGELFPFETGQTNYTLAGVDAVRAAQAALVAANPTDMTLITSAAGLKRADKVHITADNAVIRGETGFYPGMGIPT